jgi:3-oxoacyl-[acyl-carrier protein] reductase
MDLGLKNKKALVLGASAGIGRGIAQTLVQEGARVAIVSRSADKLEKTKNEIKAEKALACDLNDLNSTKKMIKELINEWQGIDLLVINTGGPAKGNFEDIDVEKWNAGFQSLWLSATESIRCVLPAMKEKKFGRILLITSLSAKEPLKALTISNGLRAGLSGLTKSLAQEIAGHGITVNCILPGYTDTDRLRELNLSTETVLNLVPAQRLGTVAELGALAAFLSSTSAGYITGQSILIDGGATRGF